MRKPTAEELHAAKEMGVPDIIAPGLRLLFCGINPGLYSAATGHHFARPGNRFWPALFLAGLTPRQLSPEEEQELPPLGIGITNVVARASAGAAEVSSAELVAGGHELVEKIERYQPRVLAILGVSAFRAAFGQPKAALGPQPMRIGETEVWVLPNPSGLNAHYQVADLAEWYRRAWDHAAERS